MSQKAIIHTATRVIRRVTIDDSPSFGSDETVIDMGNVRLDLAGGPWKLDADNITKVLATAQEADDAFTAPVSQPMIELLQALADVRDETALPAKVRVMAGRLRQFFDRRIRID